MDGICFSDQGWLQYFFSTYGVNRLECDCRVQSCRTWRESNKQGKAKAYCAHASILLYFAQSPFYDKSCSNERLRSIEYDPHLEERLSKMKGIGYEVYDCMPPSIFVIRKYVLKSRGGDESKLTKHPLDLYYCLNYEIYKCASLDKALSLRMVHATQHIKIAMQAFEVGLSGSSEGAAKALSAPAKSPDMQSGEGETPVTSLPEEYSGVLDVEYDEDEEEDNVFADLEHVEIPSTPCLLSLSSYAFKTRQEAREEQMKRMHRKNYLVRVDRMSYGHKSAPTEDMQTLESRLQEQQLIVRVIKQRQDRLEVEERKKNEALKEEEEANAEENGEDGGNDSKSAAGVQGDAVSNTGGGEKEEAKGGGLKRKAEMGQSESGGALPAAKRMRT